MWIKDHSVNIRACLFIGAMLLASLTFSQEDYGCDKPSKKAEKFFKVAERYNFKGTEAYKNLVAATKEDESYAEALSILAYINRKRFKKSGEAQHDSRAKSYWLKLHQACPAYRDYEAARYLTLYYYSHRSFKEASTYADEYLKNSTTKKKEEYQEIAGIKQQLDQYQALFDNPVPFDPQKVLGPSTHEDEYLPMLSPDNQYLFFTRRAMVDTKSAFGEVEKELFMQSRKKYDGSYSGGIPLPAPFNQGSYQGGSSISIDNKLLFITVVTQEATRSGNLYSNGDIYYSEFKEGHWSALKSIGNHINGRFTWEGQPSISSDNKTLYFASARGEDNFGGMDLYKVQRQADGSWGSPINLGDHINTSGNEKSPFMHSDSYTLYFSSDGHPGVGGFDIFFTRAKKGASKLEFDRPQNLGYPINSEEDEHGFMVSTDGKYGYFSANPDRKGLDIYSFDLPEEARPEEVVFVRGSVKSKDPDAAKGMQIELKNMETDQVVEGVVDEESGDYVAVIAASEKQDVMMMAKKNGYAFTSAYINSGKDVIGKPLKIDDLDFNPIEEGETYRINNINFATNSADLSLQVMTILNEFIEFLDDNSELKVAIQGHTDNRGNPSENLKLSQRRAKAVHDYLIIEGIDPSRLSYEGFGQKQPVASNKTESGRAKNRRTEFVILSK